MGLSASQARFLQLTARRSDLEYEVQQISYQRLALSEKMSAASTKYQDAVNNRKLTFSFSTGEGLQEVDISYNNYKNYMNQQLEGLFSSQQKYYLVSSSGNKLVVPSKEERDKMIENETTKIPLSQIQDAKAKVEAYDNGGATENTENEEGSEDTSTLSAPTEQERIWAAIDLSTCLTETVTDENGNTVEYYVEQKLTEDDFLIVEDLNDTTSFQNSLREGIYYFATYDTNKETGEKEFNIKELDTLGNGAVSDVFDTSDDAAAQAEYETTQSKVQSLDKKLEMKLNQLETERNAIQTEMDSVKKVIEDNIEKSFNTFS